MRDILGRKITFEEQELEEIKNRLKAAWAAFHNYRQELTSEDYRLCHRLRLFGMVITPTLTYASGKWTLTLKREKIKTAQRKMLRLIVQTKRKYKSKKVNTNKKGKGSEMLADEENEGMSDKETEEGLRSKLKQRPG